MCGSLTETPCAPRALQRELWFFQPPSLLPLPLPFGKRKTHKNDKVTFPGYASGHLKKEHWGAGKCKSKAAEPQSGPSGARGPSLPSEGLSQGASTSVHPPSASQTVRYKSGMTNWVDNRGKGGREKERFVSQESASGFPKGDQEHPHTRIF